MMTDTMQYNVTEVRRADIMAVKREADRLGRSTVAQMRIIIEQAAARIERAEQRRLAAQTQEQTK